ncbi:MAG: hypothetical protein J6Z79_07865 [Clostridia bacterium]|nr:hypothetical protein [Clostridia bacterium]
MKARFLMLLLIPLLLLPGCGGPSATEKTTGVENYNVTHLVSAYHGDLDSNLSVFPDFVESDNADYEATVTVGPLDIEATIILDCRYEDYMFEAEIQRLKDLRLTIRDTWHTYTNYVKRDDSSYRFPAFVTIDGFGNTYEYALADYDHFRIVYVYVSYPDVKNFPHPEFLKTDLSLYDIKDPTKGFSLYNHSFSKGTWTEFDDVIAKERKPRNNAGT